MEKGTFMTDLIESLIFELKMQLVEELLPYVKEQTEKAFKDFKKEMIPVMKDLISSFKDGDKKTDTIIIQESLLNKEKLIEIAKKHIVFNATEVVAYKTSKSDSFIVYLAYSKNKELLPIEQNRYVIIKAEALSGDINSLFGDNKLIILK